MNISRRSLGMAVAGLGVSVLVPRDVHAQLLEFRGVPSARDFLLILDPRQVNDVDIAQRSDIVMHEIRDEPSLPAPVPTQPSTRPSRPAIPPTTPSQPRPRAIAMPDVFPVASAELPPNTTAMLDSLAGAMKLAPRAVVLVTGHTDATGTVEQNDALSQRRADAAQRYLTGRHGIDVGRIQPIGVGSRQPIGGLTPTAARNRRIQIWGR